MNCFSYENQGINTFLVYKVKPDDSVDSMSLGMITNNQIDGLAKVSFCQLDDERYLKYNVSAKISASQIFSGIVNKKRLVGIFLGIVNALISAEDYMIDANSIILDFDYIFSDVSTCETVLVCLPIENMGESKDLGVFFKNIVFTTQFDQTENCDYVAKILNYLNSTPIFSCYEFKKILEEINNTNKPVTPIVNSVAPTNKTNNFKTQPVSIKQKESINVVSSIENKQVLTQNIQQPQSINIPIKNNQNFAMPQKSSEETVTNKDNSPEKKISLYELLSHYNKENAALYKAQKEAKKAQVGAEKPDANVSKDSKKKQKDKGKKKKEVGSNEQPSSFGFSIPGQAQPLQSAESISPATKPTVSSQPAFAATAVQPSERSVNDYVSPQNAQQSISASTIIQKAPVQNTNYGGSNMNFGETVVLNAGMTGDTTVLNTSMLNHIPGTPYLTRVKTNEKVHINKPVFRIGKEKSYVDYFIGDNTAISRSHANILERGGEYYIVDTNSTNHTYVDNQMIPSNQEYPIKSGAKIRLANEDFIFTIE